MKKTYISPEFVAVELRCNQMLADSAKIYSSSTENAGWAKEYDSSSSDGGSSSGSVWDDEW